ncbi:MAG: glycosyltransferase family 4 protein [bacterium]
MNVLISSPVHWWNAEAAYAAVLAEVLRQDGHKVWVLTRPDTLNHAELEARGLSLLTDIPLWERHPLRLWRAIGALRAFQSLESIQIVNVFRSRDVSWHLLAARGKNAPRLVRTRGSAMPIRGHWLNRKFYRDGCDGLIASSEVVRRAMTASLGLAPEAVRTIYYPIDLPALPDAAERQAARQALLDELALPPDALLLAVVGRVYPEKGHRELLRALAALTPRFPRLALLVLDKQVDDPAAHRGQLRALEASLGLSARVRWLGHRQDVREIMGAADIGVVPSLASEVNCRVTVEFFSVGTPVVAFPTGALPEVVEHGRTGLVTKSCDPAELAETLTTLIEDAEPRNRMGLQARAAAQTRFSRDRFLAETLAVYENAIKSRQ